MGYELSYSLLACTMEGNVPMFLWIGEIEIWRILESIDPFLKSQEFFPDMGAEGIKLQRHEVPRRLCP